MELIPAIDIRRGKCVRLVQGDPDQETTYQADPIEVAREYAQTGVTRIHLVDLDGAIDDETSNDVIVREIVEDVDVETELGGGIRTPERIDFWLNTGVTQVILGTAAVRDPLLVRNMVERYGAERLIIGVDVRGGKVATHGWRETAEISARDFARQMESYGISRFIYTAIETDGMLAGPDVESLKRFASSVRGKVTASGGVRHMEDLVTLTSLEEIGVDSVIVGKAIYEGTIDVAKAVRRLRRM